MTYPPSSSSSSSGAAGAPVSSDGPLCAELPVPDTPQGGQQRYYVSVPTPAATMTLGARGSNTSKGQAVGADGFALHTPENYAVELGKAYCVQVGGHSITHVGAATRTLTQADLGVAAATGFCAGTDTGHIEITAGSVAAPDPAFTVLPSADIPDPPVVDTGSPRSTTETVLESWKSVRGALALGARLARDWDNRPNATSSPSIAPQWASTVSAIVSAISTARGIFDGLFMSAMSQLSEARGDSSEPKVKIHGAGGVTITSPSKVQLYANDGVSLDSVYKCSVSGGLSAGVFSPVAAQVYGMAAATLKSDAAATVSARHAVVKADYAEVQGKRVAGLSSVDKVLVQSKGDAAIDAASSVAVGGETVHLHGSRAVSAGGRLIRITGSEHVQLGVGSRPSALSAKLQLSAERSRLLFESSTVEVSDGRVRMKANGPMDVTIDRSSCRIGDKVTMGRQETVIRGSVRLG